MLLERGSPRQAARARQWARAFTHKCVANFGLKERRRARTVRTDDDLPATISKPTQSIGRQSPRMPWELAETREFTMTAIESTAFGRLESEGRLLKPAHKAPTKQAGRFGFRGEIAVSLDPPVNLEAAFASARDGETTLSFLAGSLGSYKQLPALVEMLGDSAGPGGKYFIYVSDLDRASRYQIGFNDVSLYVLPIDDTSVYNELIDFLYLDKTKMKKFDTAEKIDVIADGAEKYDQAYEVISYEEGLKRLGL
jgi:hypothetical protein